MTMVSVHLPARTWTLDDVADLAASDPDHRYELQEGNLLIMPPPDAEHAQLTTRVVVWLYNAGYADRVLPTPGMRAGTSGRIPDLIVCRGTDVGRTVWIDPAEVLLAVEIVSPGSQAMDRLVKPIEYAGAGIPHFWRIERDGPAMVHLFRLGAGEGGEPTYVARVDMLLSELLSGPVPPLEG